MKLCWIFAGKLIKDSGKSSGCGFVTNGPRKAAIIFDSIGKYNISL